MKFELFPFQQKARRELRRCVATAKRNFREDGVPQVISFTAPTGSGKTIMIAALVEDIFNGDDDYPAQRDAIFVWLSDSPELNQQSLDKFYFYAEKINDSQLIMVEEDSFSREVLEDGKIYFLNTQKLGNSSNLTKSSDSRQYTIWTTLQNTISHKADKLYFIIDEAHRGMRNTQPGRATTIMQKFIKGSPEDGLSPTPLAIGMSATIQRFEALAAGSTYTKVQVSVEEVKTSGLLKDKIVVVHPDEVDRRYVSKDMAMLEAASDEWKEKCEHWEQYCTEQKEKSFKPIFVVQVMNGDDTKISETDLDECLRIISHRTGYRFEVGEVVHTFGQTSSDLVMDGLRVMYREPSKISGDDNIRVVFFKESLSTGWDCPQAETMMSFRHAIDATYIAQLLGRIIRTPLRHHIDTDDTLNDVHLYLPHFDKDTVKSIVEALHNSESGSIPTEIETASGRTKVIMTVEVKPKVDTETVEVEPESVKPKVDNETDLFVDESETVMVKPSDVPKKSSPVAKIKAVRPSSDIDRAGILEAINKMALVTHHISSTRINDYLKSLIKMAHFLTQVGVYPEAVVDTRRELVKEIRRYITKLKDTGEYDALNGKLKRFRISAQVFDPLDNNFKSLAEQDLFTTTNTDIKRQFRNAEVKLKSDGIAQAYVDNYWADSDSYEDCVIDVILFAENDNCLDDLEKVAKKLFHKLKDDYRKAIAKSSSSDKDTYNKIVLNADEISEGLFELPKRYEMRPDASGKDYSDHLFADEKTGTAQIKLNDWEERILREERRREDFVCWLRNPQNKSSTWAMCIAYEDESNETHAFYPDFLIIRREGDAYVVDILEPHDSNFRDNVGKAKALAEYAKKTIDKVNNIGIGRLELIREVGGNFKRLDMSKSLIRDEIGRIKSNSELDTIFERYGESAI